RLALRRAAALRPGPEGVLRRVQLPLDAADGLRRAGPGAGRAELADPAAAARRDGDRRRPTRGQPGPGVGAGLPALDPPELGRRPAQGLGRGAGQAGDGEGAGPAPLGGAENAMRPLRYSINITLDGCCDHRAGIVPDEELHRHAVENINQADALLFGRVTYQMMEAAFRPRAEADARPDWTQP